MFTEFKLACCTYSSNSNVSYEGVSKTGPFLMAVAILGVEKYLIEMCSGAGVIICYHNYELINP
jgi:hypothetical protein